MEGKSLEKAIGYYDFHRRLHNDCCNVIQDLIRRLLDRKKLAYNNISGRVKSRNSFIEKCKKDKYAQWNEISDLLGIRIIAYLLSDVDSICEMLESEFYVVESIDKVGELGDNEFGYLAKHLILRLSHERASLPEYSKYKDVCFEVQVKTLTQHAWATITHSRLYKAKSDELPNDLARKFNRLAGILEGVDEDFQKLCNDYDNYIDEITAKIRKGELDVEINTASLIRYSKEKFSHSNIHMDFANKDSAIINELMKFGITTLQELNNIVPNDINTKIVGIKNFGANLTTLFRQIMIISNHKLFFERSWGGDWISTRSLSKNGLLKAYGIDGASIMNEYKKLIDEEIAEQIAKNELDMDITVISLIRYVNYRLNTDKIARNLDGKDVDIITELSRFGVTNLRELDAIIPNDVVCAIDEMPKYSTNITKLLRHIMIIRDADKYFTTCWSGSWPDMRGPLGGLCQKYGLDTVELKERYFSQVTNAG